MATVIGLRAKATTIDVPTSAVVVVWAARRTDKKGSWVVSEIQMPEYPAAS
jgi:hypothetical protein